jgi:restriction endonuclease S subunit
MFGVKDGFDIVIGNPPYVRPEMFEGERILLRRIVGKQGLISTYVNEKYCNNSLLHIVKPVNTNYNSKFILSLLNSHLIGFYFISKYARKEKTFPEIRIHELENLPIKENTSDTNQTPFITLVDYLLYLHNKETPQILSHTDNTRIASHLEDILNMMVYELYFEEHMKEVGIDVLQFIKPKSIRYIKI